MNAFIITFAIHAHTSHLFEGISSHVASWKAHAHCSMCSDQSNGVALRGSMYNSSKHEIQRVSEEKEILMPAMKEATLHYWVCTLYPRFTYLGHTSESDLAHTHYWKGRRHILLGTHYWVHCCHLLFKTIHCAVLWLTPLDKWTLQHAWQCSTAKAHLYGSEYFCQASTELRGFTLHHASNSFTSYTVGRISQENH